MDDPVDLYVNRLRSLSQIAALMSWPLSRVRTFLLNAGVKLRDPHIAMTMAKREGRGISPDAGKYERTQAIREKMRRSALARGERSARGYRITPSGYVELTRGPDKGRLLHDVIGEILIGRPLEPGEMVHHEDEDRAHNEFDNLKVMTRSEHARLHALKRIAAGERMENHFKGGRRGLSQ